MTQPGLKEVICVFFLLALGTAVFVPPHLHVEGCFVVVLMLVLFPGPSGLQT